MHKNSHQDLKMEFILRLWIRVDIVETYSITYSHQLQFLWWEVKMKLWDIVVITFRNKMHVFVHCRNVYFCDPSSAGRWRWTTLIKAWDPSSAGRWWWTMIIRAWDPSSYRPMMVNYGNWGMGPEFVHNGNWGMGPELVHNGDGELRLLGHGTWAFTVQWSWTTVIGACGLG